MVFLPYEKKDFSDRIINELIYEGRTWWAGWEENSRKSEQRQEPVQRFCGVRQWSPTFLASGTGFLEDNLSMDGGGVGGDGFGLIQAHYIYCALYFYYYHIVIYKLYNSP